MEAAPEPSAAGGALLADPAAVLAKVRAERARRAAKKSFAEFVRQTWHMASPDPLVWNWHLDALCVHLEAAARGEIRRLLINIPPGHAKSIIVSVLWPAWMWASRPSWQAICSSYAYSLAVRDSVKCRAILESDWYQENYARPAGWELRHDQNTKDAFINTAFGHRYAVGVGGAVLGFRADCIIFDDPLNAQEAHSKAAREEAVRFIGQVAATRFNDPTTGSMVMIMQRLHEEDPSGWVLSGGGWEHLCLPSEFDPGRRSVTFHVVDGERREFWRDPREEAGELLFPQKFPREALEALKQPNALGADGYAGQHGQTPTPAEGLLFRKADWRFWKPDGVGSSWTAPRPKGCTELPAVPRPEFEREIVSVDATFKQTVAGSYVVIQVWGRAGPNRFLLHQARGRWDIVGTIEQLETVFEMFPSAVTKVIEAKANGEAICSLLEQRFEGVERFEPGSDTKEGRAMAGQPYQRAGNCYLPDGAPFVDDFVLEFAAFPKGKHDDQVDCFSQAMIVLKDDDSTAALWARTGGVGSS